MIFREFVADYNEVLEAKDEERKARLLAEFEESLDELLGISALPGLSDYFFCLQALPFLVERFALKIIKLNTKFLDEEITQVQNVSRARYIYQVMNSDAMTNWLVGNLENQEAYDAFLAFVLKAAANKEMYYLLLEWWKRSNDYTDVKHFPREWEIHKAISQHFIKKLWGDYIIKSFDMDDSDERVVYNVYIADADKYIDVHLIPKSNP